MRLEATVALLVTLQHVAGEAITRISIQRHPVTAESLVAKAIVRAERQKSREAWLSTAVGASTSSRSKGLLRGGSPLAEFDRADVAVETLTNIDNTAYFGQIVVGSQNQSFMVMFDTGSSDVWIPASNCSESCPQKSRFLSEKSSTYQHDGRRFAIEYGSGRVEGFWGQDNVGVGGLTVEGQRFAQVTNATGIKTTYTELGFDGIVGMGFANHSMDNASTVVQNLRAQGQINQSVFAFYVPLPGRVGELTIGGIDHDKYEGEIKYANLAAPTVWAVHIDGIRMAGHNQTISAGAPAIIDTGTSLINGPEDDVRLIMDAIGAQMDESIGHMYRLPDCTTAPPDLMFMIGGNPFVLTAEQYIFYSRERDMCIVGMGMLRMKRPFWILGDVFLANYYSVFDMDNLRVGFAPIKAANMSTHTV